MTDDALALHGADKPAHRQTVFVCLLYVLHIWHVVQ